MADPKFRMVNQSGEAEVEDLTITDCKLDASAPGAGDIEFIHQKDKAEIKNVKVHRNEIETGPGGGTVTLLTGKDQAKVKKMDVQKLEIKTGVEGVNTARNEMQQGHHSSERAAVSAPHTHDEDDEMDLT